MNKKSSYILQSTEKTRCPKCNGSVDMLCHYWMNPKKIAFYICWRCRQIWQIGVGPVEYDPKRMVDLRGSEVIK